MPDFSVGPIGNFSMTQPAASGNGLLNSLVAFYQFQTTSWLDSSPNALDLNNSFGGGSVTTAAGLVGNAAAITGTKVIYHADDPKFDFTQSFTAAYWVKYTGTPTGVPMQVGKYRSNGEWRTLVSNTSGANWQLSFLIYAADTTSNSVNWPTQDLTAFWQASWHFIVVQCDAVGNNIYLNIDNGTAVSTGKTKTITHSTDNFQVGDFDFDSNAMYDQYGVWTRVLSAADLTFLYNSGAGRAYSELTT